MRGDVKSSRTSQIMTFDCGPLSIWASYRSLLLESRWRLFDLPLFSAPFQTVNTLEAIFVQQGWSSCQEKPAPAFSGVQSLWVPVLEAFAMNCHEWESLLSSAVARTRRNSRLLQCWGYLPQTSWFFPNTNIHFVVLCFEHWNEETLTRRQSSVCCATIIIHSCL